MVGQFGAERKRIWKKRDLLRAWANESTVVRQFGMMKELSETVWDDKGTC